MPPIPYSGNAGATQSPAPPPGPSAVPILNIPSAGDRGADLWVQPFKTLADYIAYLTAQLAGVSPYFGDGSDGDVTITGGTTTLDGVVKNYNTLSISSTGILIPTRSIIRVKGLLTINATGMIHCNGANASGAAHGIGTDGGDFYDTGDKAPFPISGGVGGANGQSSSAPGTQPAGFNDVVGIDNNPLNIGSTGPGGAGGSGSGGGGGAGGGGPQALSVVPDAEWFPDVLYHPAYLMRMGTWTAGGTLQGVRIVKARGGGGGGSGGGSGTGTSGAGAAGGGVVFIIAKSISIGSTSCVQAKGGTGGNATGGGNNGGGGGGRGGRVFALHGGTVGSTLNATLCVPGGTGGAATGSGNAGVSGGDGTLMVRQVV